VLPLIIFQNEIVVAVLLKSFLNVPGKIRQGIEIEFDSMLLADERLQLVLPVTAQRTDFHKITGRGQFHKGSIHITDTQCPFTYMTFNAPSYEVIIAFPGDKMIAARWERTGW